MNAATHLLDGLQSVSLYFSQLEHPYAIGKAEIHSLVHVLSKVDDFRARAKTTYRLENILAIVFYLAMKGELHSFNYAAEYVSVRAQEFIDLGLVEEGHYPSHDTFQRIFEHLDAKSLRDAFLDRIRNFMERLIAQDPSAKGKKMLLSGDGKEFNGSGRYGKKRNANVFNFFNASCSFCLSSETLGDKDSEIPQFQKVLKLFKLHNSIITADALHCQRETAQIILKKKAGYVLQAKQNQSGFKKEIVNCFRKKAWGKRSTIHFNQCDYEFIQLPEDYVGLQWPGQKTFVRMTSSKRADQRNFKPVKHLCLAIKNSSVWTEVGFTVQNLATFFNSHFHLALRWVISCRLAGSYFVA